MALKLAEHFILVLMQPDCPEWRSKTRGTALGQCRFRDHFHDDAASATFERLEGFSEFMGSD